MLGTPKTIRQMFCPETKSNQKYCAHDPVLNNIDYMIWSAPLKFSSTLPGWCSIVELELLKKAGRIKFNKMRLIHLIHPKYQMKTKNAGRKTCVNSKRCNDVAEEQHGSRELHQARLLLLNKVLVVDVFCLTRYSGCYGMNDTKG